MSQINKFLILVLSLFMLSGAFATTNDSIMYYSNDDSNISGTTVYDISGNSKDGTLYNGVTTGVTGQINEAFDFDGTDDYLSLDTSLTIDTSADWSMSLWAKADNLASANNAIFGQYYLGDNTKTSWSLIHQAGGNIRIHAMSGSSSYIIDTTSYTQTDLNHYVLTYVDSTNTATLYINDNNAGSVVVGSGMNNVVSSTTPWLLGLRYLGTEYWDGQIDEVGIYDRALTSGEITELYTATANPYAATGGGATPTITTDIVDYYNTQDISINLTTTTNTNMSYVLNSEGEVSICTDCNSSLIEFYNYNLTFAYPTKVVNGFNGSLYANDLTANQYCFEQTGIKGGVSYTQENIAGLLQHSWYNVDYWVDSLTSGVDRIVSLNCYFNLNDGLHNITFISNGETGEVNTTVNFTIDLTNPVINNNILAEYNAYTFDFNSSCSDTNLDYCNISINSQNVALNSTSFTSTLNGNISYTITAQDLAGNNINETGIVLVNPYQYFYFTLSNGSAINNFTLGGLSYSNYANILTYNSIISLGTNNLSFAKVGYATTPIMFNITTSSELNLTTNITESTIILRIFDGSTGGLLTGLTEITLISSTGYNATTTTGLLNITNINFINEDYQIIATHSGYATETIFFTYDNQNFLNKDIYMINTSVSDYGTITLEVSSSAGGFVENGLCSALEWKPSESAYVSVAEGKTNIGGHTTMNIHIGTSTYKFSCSKSGISSESSSQIIQTTETVLPIELTSSTGTIPQNTLGSLTYSLTTSNISAVNDLITFDFSDSNNLVTEACITTYKKVGTKTTFLSENCTSASSGIIYKIIDTNQTYETIAIGLLTVDSASKNIETIVYKSTESLSTNLEQYHFDILIPLVLLIIGIVIGLALQPQNIYISIISTIIMIWLSVMIVPTVISASIAAFVTFIALAMLYAGERNK